MTQRLVLKVDLDPRLLWLLNDEAEQIGSTTQSIVAGMIRGRYSGFRVPDGDVRVETRDIVARLHAKGHTDAEIAAHADRVVGHIARVRRQLGLKPNRRGEAA